CGRGFPSPAVRHARADARVLAPGAHAAHVKLAVNRPMAQSAVLRPMTLDDIPAGLRLCRASRWNQIARDWEHFLRVNPGGALALQKDGQVVGTVATLRYGPVGWVAMVL